MHPILFPTGLYWGICLGLKMRLLCKPCSVDRQIKPFNIQLTHQDYEKGYFRYPFPKDKKAPAILKAHALTKRVSFCHEVPRYMAHLSPLYGFFPAEVKKQIIAGLPTNLNAIRIEDKNPKNWPKILTIPSPFLEETILFIASYLT